MAEIFPPMNFGGPIEAPVRQGVYESAYSVFPPMNFGGPIEALRGLLQRKEGSHISTDEFRWPH